MNNKLEGELVVFNTTNGETAFTKEVQFRMCHGEEPPTVVIEFPEFEGVFIEIPFSKLKKFVNQWK